MAVRPDQISHIRLPAWRHQPGKTEAADHEPLKQAKDLVPSQFIDYVPSDHPAFEYGLLLHDNGYFWEAHEVWEAIWIAAPKNGRDRIALKALIQIVNAGLKDAQNKTAARNRLLDEALDLLHELNLRNDSQACLSPSNSIQTIELTAALKKWRSWMEVGPKLQLLSFFAKSDPSKIYAK